MIAFLIVNGKKNTHKNIFYDFLKIEFSEKNLIDC